MATLGDVAARAGVSISAVSRVLSNHPSARVSAATRERIVTAARDLQYRPNFAGRALKSARTNVVGLVLPDLANALFTDLMAGAEDEARDHDYMILLGRSDDMRLSGDVVGRLIGEGRVDGMALHILDGLPPQEIEDVFATPAPLVLLNAVHPGKVGSIAFDDEAGARIAVEHLVASGHTRIGLVGGLSRSFTAQRRSAGFTAAMTDAGLTVPRGAVTTLGYSPEHGRRALRELMTRRPRPTAVVVANVNAAIGVLAEARALGVRVPQDLSVVSVHDSWTAENTWPPLTTVKMPFYEMGRAAVAAVVRRIETGGMDDEVIRHPAPHLIVRESVTPPAG